MNKIASADVVIFGGGIAGLWLLSRLRETGLSVILLESGALGGGQTHKSQGIIHGGLKYALTGQMTNEVQALSDMPLLWKRCLEGQGEIDLSHVPVLSKEQYLWSPNKFAGKLAGFFAGAALKSKVINLARNEYPLVFQHPQFKGEVFSLDEMVIDVPILVRELVKANQDVVYKIEPFSEEEMTFDDQGRLVSTTVYMAGKPVQIIAQQFIFTAGAGNEVIIRKLNHPELMMQRRPLHMVMVKTNFSYPLYAHCLGLGVRPRITITTHVTQDGDSIWYLGGQLAEEGIYLDSAKQIQAASAELAALFPWLDFSSATFSTFMVDRAEPKQKNDLKPEGAYLKQIENMIIAWPTKLCLAPILSAHIIKQLNASQMTPQLLDTRALRSWPMPPLAQPIWESVFCKSVA